MAKIGWGRVLAGVAAVAAGGAAYVYLKQRAKAPLYQTILSDGGFEIRRYPALLAIETIQHGSRDRAVGAGFVLLSDYMDGESRDGDAIAMTLPFYAEPLTDAAGPKDWRIRFVLPDGYKPATLPQPPHGIAIVELAECEAAAVRVPGKPSDRSFAAGAKSLTAWLSGQGRQASGGEVQAYYNSPLKPGPMRPNELLVMIA